MAKGQHTKNPGYVTGDNWAECEVCGLELYASELMERWDGVLVCPADWESRHPQEFVRAQKEQIAADVATGEISTVPENTDTSDNVPSGTFDNSL